MEYRHGSTIGRSIPVHTASFPLNDKGGCFAMQQWKSLLSEAHVGTIRWNEPLESYTTWKIGGPADALVIPGSVEQLVSLISCCMRIKSPGCRSAAAPTCSLPTKAFAAS